jgi:hypothetical protein
MIAISLAMVLTSYLLICRQDRSWLNWATSSYFVTVLSIFIFPLLSLVSVGPVGSAYAYFFCYTTYALSNLCLAVSYVLTQRIPYSSGEPSASTFVIGRLPWVFLAMGFLFYAPILIQFSSLLLHPREIYTQTRSGYGPLVFGSRAFLNLAFVVYLFKKDKRRSSAFFFFGVCVVMIFFHGSKGLFLNLLSMAMLYWVYIKGRRLGFAQAAGCIVLFTVVAGALFAVFADISDVPELLSYVQGYSDYTKNAMLVIDDPARHPTWGRLTLEAEIYARVPRVLYPEKPSNFGMFKLAQDYYPEWYRSDTGDPDFNIGMQYADFGPLAILFLCLTSSLSGILTGLVVRSLNRTGSPPIFILLLFFSGIAIVSFGSGYALPESALLAATVWLFTRPKRDTAIDSRPLALQANKETSTLPFQQGNTTPEPLHES